MVRGTIQKLRRLFSNGEKDQPEFALALSGGGARASYQVGVLKYIARAFPEANFGILTGVSAGAINAAHLANDPNPFPTSIDNLVDSWSNLLSENVYATESSLKFLWNIVRDVEENDRHGWVDTSPLRAYLEEKLHAEDGRLTHISERIRQGSLKAAAIITTSYSTGQTVVWVQGRDIEAWERPNRVAIRTTLTVDHIMASSSIPFLFPAVRIGEAWYGDGGIRLSAPLAPAIHLGADRILAVSTRYARSRREADEPSVIGYPPTAQLIGILMNAIFLDTLDQDAAMLERVNRLLEDVPERRRMGLRPIRLLLLRPSQDLGKLSGEYEHDLRGPLHLLARAFSSDKTKSPDWLSMLLFDRAYTTRLMEIGYEDAARQHDRIAAFLDRKATSFAA
ncbi:patatin-like phospholipase family protein [Rhodocaloribacter litoris]|uniref:patatin-like phospholipase family protein n=1 Tax=Rhodocaloribacter litoris TaxID=2558931 RepID=UPI00141FDDC3|nr:patatin-like phospholipase family protein [Rhodocaloribacter litoris]QXD14767.1 patatin-like phospholipase family protein [Rhodocaloribacter litoris]GIV59147.1 MAG: patatin [Rhodothermaceae bacterium]